MASASFGGSSFSVSSLLSLSSLSTLVPSGSSCDSTSLVVSSSVLARSPRAPLSRGNRSVKSWLREVCVEMIFSTLLAVFGVNPTSDNGVASTLVDDGISSVVGVTGRSFSSGAPETLTSTSTVTASAAVDLTSASASGAFTFFFFSGVAVVLAPALPPTVGLLLAAVTLVVFAASVPDFGLVVFGEAAALVVAEVAGFFVRPVFLASSAAVPAGLLARTGERAAAVVDEVGRVETAVFVGVAFGFVAVGVAVVFPAGLVLAGDAVEDDLAVVADVLDLEPAVAVVLALAELVVVLGELVRRVVLDTALPDDGRVVDGLAVVLVAGRVEETVVFDAADFVVAVGLAEAVLVAGFVVAGLVAAELEAAEVDVADFFLSNSCLFFSSSFLFSAMVAFFCASLAIFSSSLFFFSASCCSLSFLALSCFSFWAAFAAALAVDVLDVVLDVAVLFEPAVAPVFLAVAPAEPVRQAHIIHRYSTGDSAPTLPSRLSSIQSYQLSFGAMRPQW